MYFSWICLDPIKIKLIYIHIVNRNCYKYFFRIMHLSPNKKIYQILGLQMPIFLFTLTAKLFNCNFSSGRWINSMFLSKFPLLCTRTNIFCFGRPVYLPTLTIKYTRLQINIKIKATIFPGFLQHNFLHKYVIHKNIMINNSI